MCYSARMAEKELAAALRTVEEARRKATDEAIAAMPEKRRAALAAWVGRITRPIEAA